MFTQTTEYALRATAILALTPDKLVSTPELAQRTRVPANYLAKVLQQLSAASIVSGRRGVGGGYCLCRPPSEVKLSSIVHAVATVVPRTGCPLGADNGGVLCALHRVTTAAADAVIREYEGHTLADLLKHSGEHGPLCQISPANGAAAGAPHA